MGEIKLNRSPVEHKLQDYEKAVNQVKLEGISDIRGNNNVEVVEKINQLNRRLGELTERYREISTKHISSAYRALDSLEEEERMAAKGIKMIES
ncbi:YwqI/YxiC family protein [Oceanobacillus kimchii]|uniref:YwqI/YxiC family protein n=1 Tax=Oceanobacillus kimchii TaxID=746691 RepID=UPI0021A3DF15|nr:YwqI/YxiC family protein [Oceanobacillus kimchii]MCT1577038.1 YwqI/YxiC family protein [Oceanobacillus kimchii]MCT2135108.1 YwqI/YxiC family protein [Oceanobacillus kimchii]